MIRTGLSGRANSSTATLYVRVIQVGDVVLSYSYTRILVHTVHRGVQLFGYSSKFVPYDWPLIGGVRLQCGAGVWTYRVRCFCRSRPTAWSSATAPAAESIAPHMEVPRRKLSGSWQMDLPYTRCVWIIRLNAP